MSQGVGESQGVFDTDFRKVYKIDLDQTWGEVKKRNYKPYVGTELEYMFPNVYNLPQGETIMSKGYDSRAVANMILREAWQQKKALTIMQLLKLVYFAHGWSLALLNRPLISDYVEAWQYGPVVPEVYKALPGAGSRKINSEILVNGIPLVAPLNQEEKEVIKAVVENYGNLHAFQLSELTHQESSPWAQTIPHGKYTIIPNKLIQEHFASLTNS